MSAFIPPFCPWKGCSEHHLPSSKHPYQAYLPWGSYPTKAFGRVPRFRCTSCGRTFSVQSFSLDYYAKRVVDYEDISRRLSSCESLRAIGRKLGLSCGSVSNRISRASRRAIGAEPRLAASRHRSTRRPERGGLRGSMLVTAGTRAKQASSRNAR
ncbi:MAG TPA: hypothetical protein P5142_09320 [Spirochaetia bacterium]|nr:hypothetical protein [Spirochaetia bacterium]